MIYRAITRRTTLAGAIATLIVGSAVAAEPADDANVAPFGLVWGMATEDARKLGVTLTALTEKEDWGKSFIATGLTKVLSDTETVMLSFGFHDHLFRIVAVGRSQGPDPYGAAVLARYIELSRVLAERYGRGIETDQRDTHVWKEPSEYVMSLKTGRAKRYFTFTTPIINVELSIRAIQSDHAFYTVILANRPASLEFEVDNRKRERESL